MNDQRREPGNWDGERTSFLLNILLQSLIFFPTKYLYYVGVFRLSQSFYIFSSRIRRTESIQVFSLDKRSLEIINLPFSGTIYSLEREHNKMENTNSTPLETKVATINEL